MTRTLFLLGMALLSALASAAERIVPAARAINITTNLTPNHSDRGVTSNDVTTTSIVVSNNWSEVRDAIIIFCAQARTNHLYGSPAHGLLSEGIGVGICSCNTISPCYTVLSVPLSPEQTRLEVRSSTSAPGHQREVEYRRRRDPQILNHVMDILETMMLEPASDSTSLLLRNGMRTGVGPRKRQ